MAVELVKQGPEWSLVLSGVVGVMDAVALHACARDAAAGPHRRVRIRLHALESIDTAATQILLALKRDLAGAGRACDVEDTPGSVAERWRLAGITL
jgi:ABC-type transporter Mla MlaB component